jgi:hypothetical protein
VAKPIGRPPKFNEPMIRVSTRVPVSVFDAMDRQARAEKQSLHEYLRKLSMRSVARQ